MALTGFQRALLRVLARNHTPNSVFARRRHPEPQARTLEPRRSLRDFADFDIEHTTADAVRAAFLADRDILAANGYQVEELRLANRKDRRPRPSSAAARRLRQPQVILMLG